MQTPPQLIFVVKIVAKRIPLMNVNSFGEFFFVRRYKNIFYQSMAAFDFFNILFLKSRKGEKTRRLLQCPKN